VWALLRHLGFQPTRKTAGAAAAAFARATHLAACHGLGARLYLAEDRGLRAWYAPGGGPWPSRATAPKCVHRLRQRQGPRHVVRRRDLERPREPTTPAVLRASIRGWRHCVHRLPTGKPAHRRSRETASPDHGPKHERVDMSSTTCPLFISGYYFKVLRFKTHFRIIISIWKCASSRGDVPLRALPLHAGTRAQCLDSSTQQALDSTGLALLGVLWR
jgi:hypothetical protein